MKIFPLLLGFAMVNPPLRAEPPAPGRPGQPSDWTVEGGFIGWDQRSAVLGTSPYLLLQSGPKTWNKDGYFRRSTFGVGVAGARARLFADDRGYADGQVDSVRDAVLGLSQNYGGLNAATQNIIQNDFNVDYGYHMSPLPVFSALEQVGRSYPTPWPMDVGWMVTGIFKNYYLFPNLQTDVAFAANHQFLRIPLDMTLWIGDSQNLSPVGDYPVQNALQLRSSKMRRMMEANLDHAPHAGAGLRGELPGAKGRWDLQGAAQFNPLSNRMTLRGGVEPRLGSHRVRIGVEAWRDFGSAIEYDRQKQALSASYSPKPWLTLSARVENEHFRYGDAVFDGRGAFLMASGTWERPRSNMAIKAVVGVPVMERERLRSPDEAADWAKVIKGVRDLKEKARQETDPAMQPVVAFIEQYNTLIDLGLQQLSDSQFVERILVRYARSLSQREMKKSNTKFNIGDQVVKLGPMSPGYILAGVAIANSRLSPVPPLRERDIDAYLLPWMYWQATRQFGDADKNATEADVLAILLSQLPEEIRGAAAAKYGADVSQLTSDFDHWGSKVIIHDLQKDVLNYIRASDALDKNMSVDRGYKAGEWGAGSLMEILPADGR